MASDSAGYSIKFEEFVALLTNKSWRRVAHPVIQQLLDCTVSADGLSIRTVRGASLSLEAAHAQIQSDPAKQSRLYGVAMSLWR
jgi:hypothetical protein